MTKKIVALTLVLMFVFSFSFVHAEEDNPGVLPFNLRKAFTHSDYKFDETLAEDFNAVVVFNPDSRDVLFEKNESVRFVCGGSIAMMMTANIALQHLGKNTKIAIDPEIEQLDLGDKTVNLEKGQSYLTCELISAMLLYDARDAAAAVSAEYAVKSGRVAKDAPLKDKLNAAVKMMNEEAQRLMMFQTIYTNACGLTENDQRTSAEDTVRLMYALYNSGYSSYVGDTEELLGNVIQSGIEGKFDDCDPRNVDAPQFSRDICGYGYYTDGNMTVMALSKSTQWRTAASKQIEGRVFTVVATNVKANTVMNALNLMTYATSNYCILNTKNMANSMLTGTGCAHCSGTLLKHTGSCEYRASELVTATDKMPISVDITIFAVLTELYTNNDYRTFSAEINDDTVSNAESLKKGDKYAVATIYYQQDRKFIDVDLYVNESQSVESQKTYKVEEVEPVDNRALSWPLLIILGIGIPTVVWVIYTVIVTGIRRRKY